MKVLLVLLIEWWRGCGRRRVHSLCTAHVCYTPCSVAYNIRSCFWTLIDVLQSGAPLVVTAYCHEHMHASLLFSWHRLCLGYRRRQCATTESIVPWLMMPLSCIAQWPPLKHLMTPDGCCRMRRKGGVCALQTGEVITALSQLQDIDQVHVLEATGRFPAVSGCKNHVCDAW